jgi:hypothetical protein
MNRLFSIAAITLIMLLAACGSGSVDTVASLNDKLEGTYLESAAKDSGNTSSMKRGQIDAVQFLFTDIPAMNDLDNPQTEITVQIGNKQVAIDSILGSAQYYNKENYKEMGIPDNAVSACGAWWAGAGDYYYMIKTDKGVAVYQGWQDEQQEDAGYHWKLFREIGE